MTNENRPSPNILVVEDRTDFAFILRMAFNEIGFTTYTTDNSDEAALLLQSRAFEVATIDLQLSDNSIFASGFNVLNTINLFSKGTKSIVISATPNAHYVVEAYRLGANLFVHKDSGFDIDGLALDVKRLADKSRIRDIPSVGTITSILARPDPSVIFESDVCQRLGCSYQLLHQILENLYSKIFPFMTREKEPTLKYKEEINAFCGSIWSKKYGAEILILIGVFETDKNISQFFENKLGPIRIIDCNSEIERRFGVKIAATNRPFSSEIWRSIDE